VRVKNEDGWWLIRASNTQAVIVARAEAASAEGLARLKQRIVAELGASGMRVTLA
jgi:phosphomannomutase